MERLVFFNDKLQGSITSEHVLMFDMDGTLVDTNYANYLSYIEAIRSIHDIDFDFEYNSEHRFTRNEIYTLIPSLEKEGLDSIISLKNEIYMIHLDKTEANSHIVNILKAYSSTCKTALVTNSQKDRTYATLSHHNLTQYFSDIICNENQSMNKYVRAISILNIPAKNLVIFENEDSEIKIAIELGVPKESIYKI